MLGNLALKQCHDGERTNTMHKRLLISEAHRCASTNTAASDDWVSRLNDRFRPKADGGQGAAAKRP
jgi:hypothetical protein